MRRLRGAAVAAGVLAGFGGARRVVGAGSLTQPADGETHNVFFGWLLGTASVAAVAFDTGARSEDEVWPVLGYVCDGLGLPDGMAVWFKGDVDGASIAAKDEGVLLTSPGGRETLHIGHLDGYAVTGAFTDASGRTSRFAAFRATDGAGIYDVTLDEALRYAGRSTDGSELVGRAFEDGSVVGTIFAANGQEIPFHIETLARLSEEDLQAAGLPTDYRSYADNSLVPDSYVALISPAGLFWLGRSGNVRAGSPGNSIIGLDMGD